MGLKTDAVLVVGVGAALVIGAWYVKRKATGALASAGAAAVDMSSFVWNTAQAPVLDLGGGPIGSTAAAVGNGIVAAPSNVVDSLSLGLIGGSGGNTGNGGIGSMLWNILNGSAFAPVAAQPDPVDLGNGSGGW